MGVSTRHHTASIYSFSRPTSSESPNTSPPLPETSIKPRSLGDKLQLLALLAPEALVLLETYVDHLLS